MNGAIINFFMVVAVVLLALIGYSYVNPEKT